MAHDLKLNSRRRRKKNKNKNESHFNTVVLKCNSFMKEDAFLVNTTSFLLIEV